MAGHAIKAVRGMHDLLPGTAANRRLLEERIVSVLERYGYREIRFPMIERSEVFAGMGITSDVVQKQMYAFEDHGGTRLSLRPEGTAGCVRASIEHGLYQGGEVQRLWYLGPMFRHERPQQGRLRQFDQIGIEAYGSAVPAMDAEILLLGSRIWKELGIQAPTLELNTLGTPMDRQRYGAALAAYFGEHVERLPELDRERLDRNPLRLLDSKEPVTVELRRAAPAVTSSLGTQARAHFDMLCDLLQHSGVAFNVNPHLVRGLDYYTGTVFEWCLPGLGAQNAICAGGRYDQLVENMGGPAVPAIGFAIGIDRLTGLLKEQESPPARPHVYLVACGVGIESASLALAETLRSHLLQLRLVVHCGGGKLKRQLRAADRSGAEYALILGEQELAEHTIGLKHLRQDLPQETLLQKKLPERLEQLITAPVPR